MAKIEVHPQGKDQLRIQPSVKQVQIVLAMMVLIGVGIFGILAYRFSGGELSPISFSLQVLGVLAILGLSGRYMYKGIKDRFRLILDRASHQIQFNEAPPVSYDAQTKLHLRPLDSEDEDDYGMGEIVLVQQKEHILVPFVKYGEGENLIHQMSDFLGIPSDIQPLPIVD